MTNSTSLSSLLKNLKGGFNRRSRRRGGSGFTRRGGSKLASTAAPVNHSTTMRKGGSGMRRGGTGMRRGGMGMRRGGSGMSRR